MSQGNITFKKFIDDIGAKRLADLLGVTIPTVYYWRNRHCYPLVLQMQRIRKISKGLVTYEMMIDRKLKRAPARRSR